MSNYEQQLIRELRRSQGKVIGKLEKRLDRAVSRAQTISHAVHSQQKRILALERQIDLIIFARGDPRGDAKEQG